MNRVAMKYMYASFNQMLRAASGRYPGPGEAILAGEETGRNCFSRLSMKL